MSAKSRLRSSAAAAIALVGCGLIDPDVSTLRYELYPVSYTIDTAYLTVPPAFYRLRCGDDKGTCCAAIDCAIVPLACRDGACVTDFPFEQYATIDLRAEAPALTKTGAHDRAELYVSRIRYRVANGLNLDLPAIDLFLAPIGTTTAARGEATPFARLPPTPARTTLGARDVELLPDARAAFRAQASRWTAFNLIARAPVALSSTMSPLSGRVDMKVMIELAAEASP